MQTKLEQLLMALDGKELRELHRFLQSSFLNERPEVLPLLDYLKKLPDSAPFPDRETIARELYPDKSVTDLQIRRLMSYLLKGIEKYLIWQEMTADPMQMDLHLLRAYRKRHFAKGFQSVQKRIEDRLNQQGKGDETYHYNWYSFHQEKYNFKVNRKGKEPPELEGILNELDYFYIVNKLKQACNALNYQRLFNVEYSIALLEPLLIHIREAALDQIPSIQVYYRSYQTLVSEEDDSFYALKQSLDEHIELFNTEDQRSLFMLAINYCIRRLNQGEQGFLREVFELYQKALEVGILIENGILSHWTYKNIVSAALKLDEYEWISVFLNEYKDYLASEVREESYAYNKAKLFFTLDRYQDAIRLLLAINSQDLFTQLDTRLLSIKCFFEQGEWDAVEYQIDNFRQLMRRKELLSYHREHYQNFIDIVRALIKGPSNEKLRERIEEKEMLAERDWLLGQLN